MPTAYKSALSRILSTTTLAISPWIIAGHAQAQGQQPQVTSVTPRSATLCRVSYVPNFTGATDDGGGLDIYATVVQNSGNQSAQQSPLFSISVGSTDTTLRDFDIDVSAPLNWDDALLYTLDLDANGGPNFPNPVSPNSLISRAIFLSAGGSCIDVVGNQLPTAVISVGSNNTSAPIETNGGTNITMSAGPSTDLDGDPLSYLWTQTSGPTVTLFNSTNLNSNFTAPPAIANQSQTLTFSLVVNDGAGDSNTAVVTFVVRPLNQTPVADAGPDQTASAAASVQLDGTASSDGDGDPITYSWVQSAGPAVTLSNATSANPSFTAPAKTGAAQTLTFDLIVNDGIVDSAPDSVTITIPANVGPTASASAPLTSG